MNKHGLSLFSFTPWPLVNHAMATVPQLAQYGLTKTAVVTSLVWGNCDGSGKYLHHSGSGFFASCRDLTQRLGRDYLNILSTSGLITFSDSYQFRSPDSGERGTTRCYQLTPLAYEMINTFHNATKRPTKLVLVTGIAASGKPQAMRKPRSGVLVKDCYGITKKSAVNISPVVFLNMPALKRLHIALLSHINNLNTGYASSTHSPEFKAIAERLRVESLKGEFNPCTWLEERFHSVSKLLCVADGEESPDYGMIFQTYQESISGRLYGQDLHLQNVPREVRHAALSGQYDYDFDNCHYAILQQLAAKLNVRTPYIDEYLQEKKYHRGRLADLLKLPVDTVKRSLIALIYGASMNVKPGNDFHDLLGAEEATALCSDSFFAGLGKDIKRAGKLVVGAHRNKSNGDLINAMGKCNVRKIKAKGGKPDTREVQELAHILQGYEAKMINIAADMFPDRITLLQHDGFTSSAGNLDTDKLVAEIHRQTGLKMSLSIEKIGFAEIQKVETLKTLAA